MVPIGYVTELKLMCKIVSALLFLSSICKLLLEFSICQDFLTNSCMPSTRIFILTFQWKDHIWSNYIWIVVWIPEFFSKLWYLNWSFYQIWIYSLSQGIKILKTAKNTHTKYIFRKKINKINHWCVHRHSSHSVTWLRSGTCLSPDPHKAYLSP